jgi:hypothetical protein
MQSAPAATHSTARSRTVVACNPYGQPRTYRLAPASRDAAYRRLAIAILRLDAASLTGELRAARRALGIPQFSVARI